MLVTLQTSILLGAIRGHDHMVVGYTTTYAISTYMYHHLSCEFESRSWWGVFDAALCDKVCQRLVAGR
jgi:hypothetical protein